MQGFQYLNILNGGKIKRINNHVSVNHKISIVNKERVFKNLTKFIDTKVNSYHNFGITIKDLSKRFRILASIDQYVESAVNINESQLGIMWHPEREKKFSKKSILLFKNYYSA